MVRPDAATLPMGTDDLPVARSVSNMPLTRWEPAYVTQARVIGALILRDMRTRFGRSHWGMLITVGWPFAHIFVIVGIMVFRKMPAPIGHSVVLFVVTGLIPFIGFMYMSRKVMDSIVTNRPLLFFPQVKSIDIITARAIVEIITFFGSSILCLTLVFLLDLDPFPVFPGEAIMAILAAILVSLGIGTINACVIAFFQPWIMGYVLVMISLYSLSGTFFVPQFLPQAAFDILSWNPVLQCIVWFRYAYYPGYPGEPARAYALICGACMLAVGLLLDRFVVRRFNSN